MRALDMVWSRLLPFAHRLSPQPAPATPSVLSRELFWWRHAGGVWTRVTFRFPDLSSPDAFRLRLRLHDARGREGSAWSIPVEAGEAVVLDSRVLTESMGLDVDDGILSVETHADSGNGQPSTAARSRFARLYGYIDWLSDEGEIAGLHSDQVARGWFAPLELTEVVLTDTKTKRHALVYLAGDEEQPGGTVRFRAAMGGQAPLEVTLKRPLKANRPNVLWLDEVFGRSWKKFGDGPVLLSGRIDESRHYTRPYVLSVDQRTSAYHGGDRYQMGTIHHFEHQLLGEGEVNPAVVIENDELSTLANLLNSHGALEEDFEVGVRLYDQSGHLVAHEPRFGTAHRHGLSRCGFASLIPARPFLGYAAFTFTGPGRREYPGHLQALMEYRARDSVARMMFWSDQWNTGERQKTLEKAGVPYQAYGRLLDTENHEAWWAITNCGDASYASEAEIRLEVRSCEGWSAQAPLRLGPHETVFRPLRELIPSAADRLVGATGICLVESTSDLAMAQFFRHKRSGVWAAEHVMSVTRYVGDQRLTMAGS